MSVIPFPVDRRRPARGGVFETDAPVGYVALVVYDEDEQLVLRLEIREAEYSPSIVPALAAFLRSTAPQSTQTRNRPR